jgi:hypothetical protein
MKPEWLQRLHDEYTELEVKLGKLLHFIDGSNGIFNSLSLAEKLRLRRQATYMSLYRDVLLERINHQEID